jgi:hypothetical protein
MLAFSSNCASAEVAMLPDYILESALWGPLTALGVLVGSLLVGAVVHVALLVVVRHRSGRDPRAA